MAHPTGQPLPWQLNFQEAASPVMESLHDMHHLLLFVITGIATTVLVLMGYIFYKFHHKRHPTPQIFTHNSTLEAIWTIIPVIILIVIGIPSIRLLHKMETPVNADITIKAIGHQWYWSYEYPDAKNNGEHFEFDSYMLEEKDLKPGQLRLLDVDNPMVVPVDTIICVLITAADVLHSFAVPALGIKKDAAPGRINETWFSIKKPGMYYGQCSKLCGAKHGFMPIVLKAVTNEEYKIWLNSKTTSTAPKGTA
ncbi:MAG: cytochrome c oxidase subunit II [Pseudomonadota bacterium]|jgi:cytochrome c oxidase subunit 2|nr:cytochrome c oxidase subunit II [Alphaproteobacteria bacterium]